MYRETEQEFNEAEQEFNPSSRRGGHAAVPSSLAISISIDPNATDNDTVQGADIDLKFDSSVACEELNLNSWPIEAGSAGFREMTEI